MTESETTWRRIAKLEVQKNLRSKKKEEKENTKKKRKLSRKGKE